MKKLFSVLLGICIVATSALGVACGNKSPEEEEPVFNGWTPENILERPVTQEDILIGSWVTFADTKKGWSAVDQVERYYHAGINFMPYVSTLPKAGMINKVESTYLKRDLTDTGWWKKIDELMVEYNMVYYFTTLAGIGGDYETIIKRPSMLDDNALSDARDIIPQLKNVIGVHVLDEPGPGAFPDVAKWAKRYAAIDYENADLEILVNHLPGLGYSTYLSWIEQAGEDVKILSHDRYPFNAGGTDYQILGDMNDMRKVANQYGIKLSCFPQSCRFVGRRMPNFEEIVWNFNTYLAHGFTNFMYFNYIMYPNEGCDAAVFNIDGSVMYPELHEDLSLFHRQLRTLGVNLGMTDLMAKEVYLTRNLHGVAGVDVLPAQWLVDREGLENSNFILSLFTPKEGAESQFNYLNIVNNSFEKEVEEQEFFLEEGTGITGLEWYNAETGKFENVNIVNGAFTLSFGKSESKFLRITGDIA